MVYWQGIKPHIRQKLQVFVIRFEAGFGRDRTIAAGLGADGGERILRCVGSPACVAKNRYNLPAELPLSWPALMQALTHDTNNRKED